MAGIIYGGGGVTVCSSLAQLLRLKSSLPLKACTTLVISRNKGTASISSVTSCPVGQPGFWAKPYKDIPGPSGVYNLPFIGLFFHLKPFGKHNLRNIHLLFDELVDKYGQLVRLRMETPSLLVSNVQDMIAVLRANGERLPAEIFVKYYERTGHTPDFIVLQDKEMWDQKSPVNKQVMRNDYLYQYLPEINSVTDDLMKLINKGFLSNPATTQRTLSAFAAEASGVPLFNTRMGFMTSDVSEEAKTFLDSTNVVMDLVLKCLMGQHFMFRWFRTKNYNIFEANRNNIKSKTRSYVERAKIELERQKRMGTRDPKEKNVLFNLLDNPVHSLDDVAVMMDTMYMGSSDSSGLVIQSMLHTVATHPDKQEKLRQEIMDVVGPEGPLTKEALAKLPYLKATAKEALRYVFPQVAGTFRELKEDITLSGYRVPAGTRLFMNFRRASFEVFEDADKFLPERWLRGASNKPTEDMQWANLPFGHGTRGCPGKRVAELEMHTILFKILQKMEMRVSPACQDVRFEYGVFIEPERPIWFEFTPLATRSHTHQQPASLVAIN